MKEEGSILVHEHACSLREGHTCAFRGRTKETRRFGRDCNKLHLKAVPSVRRHTFVFLFPLAPPFPLSLSLSLSLSLNFSPSLLFVRRCSNAMKINIAFFFSNFVSQTILVSRDCRGLIVTTNLPADKSSFSFFEELSLSSRSDSRDFPPPFSATFRLRCDRRP